MKQSFYHFLTAAVHQFLKNNYTVGVIFSLLFLFAVKPADCQNKNDKDNLHSIFLNNSIFKAYVNQLDETKEVLLNYYFVCPSLQYNSFLKGSINKSSNCYIQTIDTLPQKGSLTASSIKAYLINNYFHEKTKFDDIRKTNKLLLSILIIISALFSILIFVFFKQRKSYFNLVRKNIELKNNLEEYLNKLSKSRLIHDSERKKNSTNFIVYQSEGTLINLKSSTLKNCYGTEEVDCIKCKEKQIKDIILKLEALMENSKFYLSKELTLEKLANKLNSNRTYLSRAINSEYNINFITYINRLRIKEAIRLFSQSEHKTLTIEAIAAKVGFNNRTSFITAFHKCTGITPSYYIRNMKQVQRKIN